MLPRVLLLLALFALPLNLPAQTNNDMVHVQLPGNDVTEVANLYEMLSGKTLIRDANLAGVGKLSIVVPGQIPRDQAIALLESALLLNGFSIVNVDDKTAKLLGTGKQAKSEGVPLYTNPEQLPEKEEIVSYFMPFRYLKSEDALTIFNQYVQVRPNLGSIVAVPNVNALVITETSTLVRRLIALKNVIDVEGARTITEFFVLERANAEKVAEILKEMFEKPDESSPAQPGSVPPQPQVTDENGQPVQAPDASSPGQFVSSLPQKIQIFADTRTNRVIVSAPESRMPTISSIIENLDMGVGFEEPLEIPLRFVRAEEVLPVLANLLVEGDDEKSGKPEIVGGENNNQGGGSNRANDFNDSGFGSNSLGGSGGVSLSGNTTFQAQDTAPQSVIVGNSRIIADRSVNKIIVFGPPESREKARQVLSMLDQRPKQVYLKCVIGQLTLGDNIEFGVDYLIKAGDVKFLGSGSASDISNLLAYRNGSFDIVPGTDDVVATAAEAATAAIPALSGLTVFGAIGNSVDFLVRALDSTNKFEVISAPTVYTANGQSAVIASGQQVPVPTSTLTSAIDVNNVNTLGNSIASNIDYKNVVLELEVRPLINSNHEVTLNIKQKNDNLQENREISGNQVPVIGTQVLNTTVTVPNRSTIVLGGLISDEETRLQTGIPFLKDIPGLGYFFGTTQKGVTRRELIIMIQPFIVDSDVALKEVNYIERANTSFKEGMFDQPAPIRRAELPGVNDPKPELVQ